MWNFSRRTSHFPNTSETSKIVVSLGGQCSEMCFSTRLLYQIIRCHTKDFMKNENIDLNIDLNIGSKNFTAYTMDLTKKYIEINADYRS